MTRSQRAGGLNVEMIQMRIGGKVLFWAMGSPVVCNGGESRSSGCAKDKPCCRGKGGICI
jgi:hypothetical protein